MSTTNWVKCCILCILALILLVIGRWPAAAPSSASSPIKAEPSSRGSVVKLFDFNGTLRKRTEHVLQGLDPANVYSLSLSVGSPRRFGPGHKLALVLRDARRELVSKTLHVGDPDLYVTFRPTALGAGSIALESHPESDLVFEYQVKVLKWTLPSDTEVEIETEPNNTWEQANPIHLGKTIFGTADDIPYIPHPDPQKNKSPAEGEDWFRFEFTDEKPKLVFFMIDLMERDNIPVDVSVYRIENAKPKAYEEGMDPVTPPHETQALPGNKFTTRVLKEKGTYYIRVIANHPFYQLRTSVYDVPPYTDPRQAVRTAVDYIMSAGDSWHANTPRKGGLYNRVANLHQETSLCVACHATHFPLRAQLYAIQNGYPVHQRPQLQFLTERFYNNPRPFYGHPDASWARVISAPANVLSRMAALLNIYEHEVTNEYRDTFYKGISEYLKLYYKARAKLPADESNGNTPIVSTYEVAWYSWVVLDEQYRRTGDKSSLEFREQLRRLIEQTHHKNMLDLCYQTLALCTIDSKRYADRIHENCEKILAYQRPSGQWAMNFDREAPEAEFQTGHCLWVLAVAGYKPDDPRIAKALSYLLTHQQTFGGWFDPFQPYENFRTPFRETQMAVLSLSHFYPGPSHGPAKGWGLDFPRAPERLDFARLDHLLASLDNIWNPPSKSLLSDIVLAAQHEEALVRQAALACLGRVGEETAVGALKRGLGDPCKFVQRTAASSLRQLASRKGIGLDAIKSALRDKSDRVRWGATRVFATHFSSLAHRLDLAESLSRLAEDPVPTIRMQALKGLWQWWYWNDNPNLRDRIENLFMARLAEPEHPWVRRNLEEGLYNIADENIRYLYNNWVPLLGTKEDRQRAIQARLDIERHIAEKVARALRSGNRLQQAGVLRGLSEFHLRDADSYTLDKRGAQPSPSVYTRIGNDIETVQFFGESAELIAHALIPLLNSSDAEIRRLATKASFTLRAPQATRTYGSSPSSGVQEVVALAGAYGIGHQLLTDAVYQRLVDSDHNVRAAAKDIYKSFTLDGQNRRGQVNAVLVALLESSYPEANLAALDAIYTAGPALAEEPSLAVKVKPFLWDRQLGTQAAALRALESLPQLVTDEKVLVRIEEALTSQDRSLLGAAIEVALKAPAVKQNPKVVQALDRTLGTRDNKQRTALLNAVSANRALLGEPQIVRFLCDGLRDSDTRILNTSLAIVRQQRDLQKQPPILAALDKVRSNPSVAPSTRSLAEALYRGRNPSDFYPGQTPKPDTLDYVYFVTKIQPILVARGRDGNACVNCHATHAILKLDPPSSDGHYTEAQLQGNYRSALKVVDTQEPEKSLILRKPTSNPDTEGVVGSDTISHGGGFRWGVQSEEYRTILEWINGAQLIPAHAPNE